MEDKDSITATTPSRTVESPKSPTIYDFLLFKRQKIALQESLKIKLESSENLEAALKMTQTGQPLEVLTRNLDYLDAIVDIAVRDEFMTDPDQAGLDWDSVDQTSKRMYADRFTTSTPLRVLEDLVRNDLKMDLSTPPEMKLDDRQAQQQSMNEKERLISEMMSFILPKSQSTK